MTRASTPACRRRRFAARLLACSSLFALAVCRADVPTPAQECRLRNAAICELNGVPYVVDGPCPATARTIRAPGSERCEATPPAHRQDEAEPSPPPAVVAPASGGGPPPAGSRPPAPLAPVDGRRLPLLGGGLLLAAACLFVLRRQRARRAAGKSATDGRRPLWVWLLAAAAAVALAYQAAVLTFRQVFGSADNHDTALPWLLAAPLALLMFVLVSALAYVVLAWLLGCLLQRTRRTPGKGGVLPDDGGQQRPSPPEDRRTS